MTTSQVTPSDIVDRFKLKNQLASKKQSVAHISLYIGLKVLHKSCNFQKTNYWIYPADGDHDTCVKDI
jgi:all-trans-retinol 13,14-reductase